MFMEIDEGFLEHPKTLQLCATMGNPLAFGYMLHFWRWACRSCKDGNLTGLSVYVIEEAAKYHQHDGKLFAAMSANLGDRAGFLDVDSAGLPVGIHNWGKRTGGAIARMDAKVKANKERRDAARLRHTTQTDSGTMPASVPPQSRHDAGQTRQDKSSQVQSSQDIENTDCAETPEASSPPAEPPLLTFPCDGDPRQWHLTQSQVDHWKELFPSLDILAQCRSALAWVEANPSKRKTATGMPRTLVAWFSRSQNRGGDQPSLLPQHQPRQARY